MSKHPHADILIAIANGEQFVHTTEGYSIESVTILNAMSCGKLDTSVIKIKPKTIMINGHEVPEPLKVKPVDGTSYYYPSLDAYAFDACEDVVWTDDSMDNLFLNRGILHSTREAAIKHAEALLSFTKVKE